MEDFGKRCEAPVAKTASFASQPSSWVSRHFCVGDRAAFAFPLFQRLILRLNEKQAGQMGAVDQPSRVSFPTRYARTEVAASRMRGRIVLWRNIANSAQ
jgi:hypothetical protein